ncbi:aminotransferase DegT [Paenibacillus sp. BIHB 4019]|uniref:Aminotransferase DegT n=1 Tax=Paenibacillus sp. BIHB 4019 TaxID=1870819 RepID=A0A1B2DGY2_9BACL|nr:LegC family aminotransferase [Paenibacillus sp. BIHB 4019]ANY66973.1 aminotransferase DegT [Paenibacillus sp. BIHB 4019]
MKTESLAKQIVESLKQALPNRQSFTALHEPVFQGNEWDYVKECLDTGWVSSVGKFVDRFEYDMAAYTDSPYAIAVVNGTAALHISLLLAGVEKDDEVLIPSLTFVATANAISYCQAIPHLVDVARDTLGLDPIKLAEYLHEIAETRSDGFTYNRKTQRRIAAVVPMHAFGHPVDLDALMGVCERYRLVLVEDAAESLGSYYRGKHTGTYGKLAALSFNGNKIITTGGGGIILTADEGLAKQAKHLTTTAKVPHRWAFQHDQVGYNYRLPNLNAALGCAQLEKLPQILHKKRQLAERYKDVFSQLEGAAFVEEKEEGTCNYWLNTLLLNQPDELIRDQILELTNDAGFMTRPIWTPMHRLPMYSHCPQMDMTVTEELEHRVINIPSGSSLYEDIVSNEVTL